VWKFFAVLAGIFLIVSVVFGILFFTGQSERNRLIERNRILENQSIESRRIIEENLERIAGLETNNGQLRRNIEQLQSDNRQLKSNIDQLSENNRTIRSELDRYTEWIAEYFGNTGSTKGER
jgi:biopolymer transport protein ExbB/TolQ